MNSARSQITDWVSQVPLNVPAGPRSLPSAVRSVTVVSDRTTKSSMTGRSNLVSSRSALTGVAGVKVRRAENETQSVGGLSDYEEMYGKELEERRQSPIKGKGRLNNNVSNIFVVYGPGIIDVGY